MLDEVDEARFGPMEILEPEHHWLNRPECFDEDLSGLEQRSAVGELAGTEARHDRERLRHGDGAVVIDQRLDESAELGERVHRQVGIEDPGRLLHDVSERAVSSAFSVGERTASDHTTALALDHAAQLSTQPALADTGTAEYDDEVRLAVVNHTLPSLGEQIQLSIATQHGNS